MLQVREQNELLDHFDLVAQLKEVSWPCLAPHPFPLGPGDMTRPASSSIRSRLSTARHYSGAVSGSTWVCGHWLRPPWEGRLPPNALARFLFPAS